MKHGVVRAMMLLGVLSTAACGSTRPPTAATIATISPAPTAEVEPIPTATDQPAATPEVDATTAAAPESDDTLVTPIMSKLKVKGEQYAMLGDPKAPLTVIEFSDYGCPFCRRYVSSTFQKLKEAYIDTGKVYYVYKDFPIVQLHPQAELAAEAAECSGAQGRYWEMHKELFAAPSQWDITPSTARASFTKYVRDIKIDPKAFETCMDSHQSRVNVFANIDEGTHLGITGTPSFVINGKLLSGAQPIEVFQRVFDRELKALGSKQ